MPALALPKGGGAIRGIGETFSTRAATGTSTLAVPIAMSPGRGGVEPGLQLHYDSGLGNSPFGLGWDLSTPSITRRTERGLPTYADEADTFVLAGAADLVPGDATDDAFDRGEFRVQRYRPRTEGAFARIERWTLRATGDAHWRTTTRDNALAVFGRTAQARIVDPDRPDRVFAWLLEETRDDRGNVARYLYKGEDGAGVDAGLASESSRFDTLPDGTRRFRAMAQRYLKHVQYGNRVPVARDAPAPTDDNEWMFEAVLDYGEHDAIAPAPSEAVPWPVRSDPFSSYRATFEVRTYRRCARVLMFHRFPELGPDPVLVRSTDFAYDEVRVRTPDETFTTGPIVTYLASVTRAGYVRTGTGGYERATLPPLALDYIRPVIRDELHALDPRGVEHVPGAPRAADAQWVDLDGEGLPGVLIPTDHAWYYRSNLGDGQLAPPALERSLPVPAALGRGAQFVDLGGDGNLDLVRFAPPNAGYFARTPERGWAPFAPLRDVPNIDWSDPQLRTLDVDGDGLPDVLIARDDAFVWYRSRAAEGFDAAIRVPRGRSEDLGPAIVFADGTETIHLADMSGDGLVDLVRVRNGEVCYWPNLGHGRFGRKITLDHAPRFDNPELFDPQRVRFADIDGSGVSDILYSGRDGVRVYFNHSGNALSPPLAVRALPPIDAQAQLAVVDLLGRGTACLVWSSLVPGSTARAAAYVDLMGGQKPHLLASVVNNLGAETRIAYASSTEFYLADRAAGRPWLTRLAFPVQVVARVEHVDRIAGSRLVSRFAYHHGYFDGVEREFRGFARVEQWDAESLGSAADELVLPPVRTVTWFHTGAWLERARLESSLAAEYYSADPQAPRLPDTRLPDGLTTQEEREAARALAGSQLRQEIYAEDGLPESIHPYSVSEQSYAVRLLQHPSGAHSGVFFVHAHDSVTLHYERKPLDPRVQHAFVLDVDDFGNVTRSAELVYPRRTAAQPEQARLLATVSESAVANRPDAATWYRIGVPVSTTVSELTGLVVATAGVLTADALRAAITAAIEIPYEATATGTALQRRVIGRTRIRYERDDLGGPLPLGTIESRAIVHETYRQALTPGLIGLGFGDRVTAAMLSGPGAYVQDDGVWWAPSGRVLVDPARFYLPVESIDLFGNHHQLRYDAHALLPVETEDPLGNRVTVENDYRVLRPVLVTDPNLNRAAVALDALGLVVATAQMGKAGTGEGDTLDDPTTILTYDLHRWIDTAGAEPAIVHVSAREKHGAANARWQDSYLYSDGSGRAAMTKTLAAGGRWIGSGRTVFDNKGNPVKQYEPFFADTFAYETDAEIVESGVTAIRRYDPLGRLVRTDLPDGTIVRVAFDAWQQATWDANDTVAESDWLPRAQHGGPAAQRSAALALAHAGTPTLVELDTVGRAFLGIADNGAAGKHATRIALDIEGHARAITDPRGVVTVARVFDMLGRAILETSADAGETRTLIAADNQPIVTWTARGHVIRQIHDSLRRPTHLFSRLDAGPETLVERVVYGESVPAPAAKNLRGTAHQLYDGAGVVVHERFDFDGNPVAITRRLAADYRAVPDWTALAALSSVPDIEAAAAGSLEAEALQTVAVYDALGRAVSRTTPDGSETVPTYDDGGQIERIDARVRGAAVPTVFLAHVEYNARGQRVRVDHGNGTRCAYRYDPETFRLAGQRTTRPADGHVLQDLAYTYDPVGNIVQVSDAVAFGNPAVSADGMYEYDPLYRLVSAEGREHPGQQPTDADATLLRVDNAADLQSLRRYQQAYTYDPAGNLLETAHRALGAGPPGWTRRHAYAQSSNRLTATSLPGDAPGEFSATYAHDAHGNMTTMPHLAALVWDHANRLKRADRGGGGTVYFTSDASGHRVRKAYEHGGFVEERIYLDEYELYRKRSLSSGEVALERQTLSIHDGATAVALVESKTIDTSIPAFTPTTRFRFQLADHLGTTTAELDESGGVFSYEECYPFGATAWRAASSATEVSARRYRYLGKERDEETGLYALGLRYYAAWLGRWTSPDPAGYVDGTNLYRYARNNPIVLRDPGGTDSTPGPASKSVQDVIDKILKPRGGAPSTPTPRPAAAPVPKPAPAPVSPVAAVPATGVGVGVGAGAAIAAAAGIAATGGVILGTGYITATRSNSIARYGNPWGVPNPGFPPALLARARQLNARPTPRPGPNPEPKPAPEPDKDEDKKKPKLGRIYVTYLKYNTKTGLYYIGRTSMIIDLNKPIRLQAELAVRNRDANHHIDEEDEPTDPAFQNAELDMYATGSAVNYKNRYNDDAYLAIRGREQQGIDYRGGAQSDTRPGPPKTENAIRAVRKDNKFGRGFHDAANAQFGQLHPYTGF